MIYDKAYEYAKWSVKHPDAPKYVKKQCAEFIKIWDDKDTASFFDHNQAEKIETLLTLVNVPKGEGTGKPVTNTLVGFQWLLLLAPFCIKMRDDPEKRRYETIVLEIARKNAKSYISALICLILMILEPKYSRFFTVAPTGALARETFRQIKEFISVSSALSKHFKLRRDNVICTLTESEYTPLNYSTSTLDGRLPNAYLGDELGALTDNYPIEAMRSGSVLLKNKLGILMSTKYPNPVNCFENEVQYCKNVLDGVVEDITTFSLLYEPDNPKGDWMTDERILKHANPLALEVEQLWFNLIANRNKAIEIPSNQSNFLTKHCNIITTGLNTESYINIQDLIQCKSKKIDWKGQKVYLGLDLSQTTDNTAVAMVARNEYGKLQAMVMPFVPKDRVEYKSKREKVNYQHYIDNGQCIACGEDVISYGTVEEWILNIEKEFNCSVEMLGYDRYNCISTADKLQANGIPCVEVKQHSSVLHPATKLLQEEIITGNFEYEDNELLEINFNNCRLTYDTNLNMYVNKKKSLGKIDMVVALINAVYILQQNESDNTQWAVQY